MVISGRTQDRRTSVDEIFDYLYEEIRTLRLRPGDKISEAEVAAHFGTSRQPVRDAFSRLEIIDLLNIRPQRATEVKRFSMVDIQRSRFVRMAIEAEVLRRAAKRCDDSDVQHLAGCLSRQKVARDADDYRLFTELDYEFHQQLCEVAGVPYAFDVISAEKAKVDRLCLLSLSQEQMLPQLYDDHRAIVEAVQAGDSEAAVAVGALHLSRLDHTINTIAKTQSDYFEAPADTQ
ncbi:MAG: GntR family transcriptional regulator [Gammaproteobacteria bacterium]|nr:GntR family transcriptional regulator [Gammaproteobacteria bacterium]